MEKKEWKTISMRVDMDFYNKLKEIAHSNYMTISGVLRKALKDTYGIKEDCGQD